MVEPCPPISRSALDNPSSNPRAAIEAESPVLLAGTNLTPVRKESSMPALHSRHSYNLANAACTYVGLALLDILHATFALPFCFACFIRASPSKKARTTCRALLPSQQDEVPRLIATMIQMLCRSSALFHAKSLLQLAPLYPKLASLISFVTLLPLVAGQSL